METVRNNLKKSCKHGHGGSRNPTGVRAPDRRSPGISGEERGGAGNGKLEKFSLTATQAIRLRAKYPIRARSSEAKVYEYYEPEIRATVQQVEPEVARRK